MSTINITNTGPIEHLEIPVPEGGGVVVMRGRNGAGKSHALAAVDALTRGTGRIPVQDGALGATVEGLGARLTVSARASRAGTLEVDSIDAGDVGDVVDPGLVGEEASDARRIAALCRLARVEASPALFGSILAGSRIDELLGGDIARPGEDLPALAGRIKRACEAEARRVAKMAAAATARAEAIGEIDDDALLGESDAVVLDNALSSATIARARIDYRSASAAAHAISRAAAEAQIAAAGTPLTPDEAAKVVQTARVAGKARIAQARAAVTEADAEVTAAREVVDAIRDRLAEATATMAGAEADLRASHARVTEVEESATGAVRVAEQTAEEAGKRSETITAAQRALAETAPVAPTPDEIALADEAVAEARDAVTAGAEIRRIRALIATRKAHRSDAMEATIDAQEWRDRAAGTAQVLTAAIARVAPAGMRVDAGRLVVATDRSDAELYSDLSTGERWRIALDVAAAAVGPSGIVPLRQEAWEALDPEHQAEVAAIARARGIVLLTAEATDGDLRAEIVGEEETT